MTHTSARRLRLMLGTLLTFLAAVSALCWVMNPYGAWRPLTAISRLHLYQETLNVSAEDWRLRAGYHVRASRPSLLLLGSSRVQQGMPVDERHRDRVLNAAIPGVTLAETAALVRLAIANPDLRMVIWGIDFYAFGQRFTGFRDRETEIRLASDGLASRALRATDALLSTRAFGYSLWLLAPVVGLREPPPAALVSPWPQSIIRQVLVAGADNGLPRMSDARLGEHLRDHAEMFRDSAPSSVQLALFRETVDHLRQSGVLLIVFVPLISDCELALMRHLDLWAAFQTWKADVAAAAGWYYDFSGDHAAARDARLFQDTGHFKPAVGHVILRSLLGLDCSDCGSTAMEIAAAGARVNNDTIADHLARQEELHRCAAHERTRCVEMVERQFLTPDTRSAQSGASG